MRRLLGGEAVTLEFWHGHGGQNHRFTLLPEHYAELLAGNKVMIETSEVEDHSHMLFIDPSDPQYLVEGAEPVEIPVCYVRPQTARPSRFARAAMPRCSGGASNARIPIAYSLI